MENTCTWCKSLIDLISTDEVKKYNITQGVCLSCAEKLNSEAGIDLSKFLNELNAPVVILDKNGVIRSANDEALKLIDKNIDKVTGHPGGEVFDCVHSKELEGCGNTVDCVTCTIRSCVMSTFSSGVSLFEKPAILLTGDPQNPVRLDFLISTEKVDGYVLLRVDQISSNNKIIFSSRNS